MNFALSDEQEFLKEAARGALSRVKTIEAAREALDGGELPDLWPTACEAGWAGLLVSEEHGGAALQPLEAMLVFEELGRVLASVPLLGHLPASLLLDRGGDGDVAAALAEGTERAAFVPARPPTDLADGWTVDPEAGLTRAAAPELADGKVTGTVHWVPDAAGADHLVVVLADGRAAHVRAVDATVEPATLYDVTRPLAHVAARERPGHRARHDAGRQRRGVVPGAGADRRGGAGRHGGRDGGQRRLRARAAHVRAADRLLPGGEARAGGDPAPQRQRPLAHVLRRLGGQGQAGRVPAGRVRLPPLAPARRSTTPRARRSPSTAGSARRGSTMRRCTSAARSSRAGCSAATPGRPTGSPASC